MSKPSLSATTETTTTAEVRLRPNTRRMVVQRCEEHAALATVIKDAKARQQRLHEEVETLFKKDKQGKALLAGTTIAGHKVKLVCGETATLDKMALMMAHGLVQADLDACTEKKPKKPYLLISSPKETSSDVETGA